MMEEKLERIAVALENIANGLEKLANPLVTVAAPKKQKAEKPASAPTAPVVSDDIIPGQDDAPVAAPPAVDAAPSVSMCVDVKDAAQLRAFTQKALDAAEKESKIAPQRPQLVNELVTFIKGEVCAKFSPNEPKTSRSRRNTQAKLLR